MQSAATTTETLDTEEIVDMAPLKGHVRVEEVGTDVLLSFARSADLLPFMLTLAQIDFARTVQLADRASLERSGYGVLLRLANGRRKQGA